MSSAAVMTASWSRRGRRNAITSLAPGPMNPAGNVYSGDAGGGPIGLTVEIYLGDTGWVDVSTYCYYRDMVRIQNHGRANETVTSTSLSAQTCTLTLNNRDGRFTPTNPYGPYYGLIGRNTPLRVSRYANGVKWYRFHGEVTAWPTTSDISGSDVYEQITVAGMVRRFQQGSAPLQSVMRRAVPTDPLMVAYWPCEDNAGATQLAAVTGAPMQVAGTLNAAQYSGFAASASLPTLGTDVWKGSIGPGTTTSGRVSFFVSIPSSTSIADGSRIASIALVGGISRVDVLYRSAAGLTLRVYDTNNVLIQDSGVWTVGTALSLPLRVTVNWDLSGSGGTNLGWGWYNGTLGGAGVGPYTLTQLISGASAITINPDGACSGASIGHIWAQGTSSENVWSSTSGILGGLAFWTTGFADENAISRFRRLCSEQAVNFEVANGTLTGFNFGVVGMGPQPIDTFVNLLQECATTDLAIPYEARDQLAMAMRTRVSLYNQSPRLVLDVSQHQLSAPLNPLDDDQYTVNDIIVGRTNGSSYEAVQATGSLNVSPPPLGVGDYQNGVAISLYTDTGLPDQAGWRLHMGTVPDARYPQISLNLRHPQFTGNAGLLSAALASDVGDMVQIVNPPAQLPPDPIELIIQGYSETLGIFEHNMVINTSPESAWEVAVYDDPVRARYDTDGSTLASAVSVNLNPNPTFSSPSTVSATSGSLAGWAAKNGAMTSIGGDSGTPLPSGANVPWGALLTPNGVGQSLIWQGDVAVTASRFTVTPTTKYFASALVYSPGGYGAVQVGIDWWDGTGTFISTSAVPVAVSAGMWTALTVSGTAPSNAASGSVNVGQNSIAGSPPTAANTLYVLAAPAWSGTVSVATTSAGGGSPLWTTNAADFPFDIAVGGERMTVAGITGASSPQTFTVTRAVNGVIKSQTVGTGVHLFQQSVYSL